MVNTKQRLKLPTLRVREVNLTKQHLSQIHFEHYWHGEFDWRKVRIVGREMYWGFILCLDKATKKLRMIAPWAYLDDQMQHSKGKNVMTLTEAQERLGSLPELFLRDTKKRRARAKLTAGKQP